MLPSIDLRLSTLVKALEQVIAPALPAGEKLARDQIRLCVGHLAMIGQQWRWAGAFEAASLAAMIGLGERLLSCAEPVWHAPLGEALEAAGQVKAADLDGIGQAVAALGGVIDRIILGEDGKLPLSAQARAAILDYGEEQARRERTWFAMNGLDPDRQSLTDIPTMMAAITPQP